MKMPITCRETASAYTEGTLRTGQAYDEAERNFSQLLKVSCLDEYVSHRPRTVRLFKDALEKALAVYTGTGGHERENRYSNELAHLFLQRVLYRINRLKLFWFDDLSNYRNERSSYLREVRERIEGAWHSVGTFTFGRRCACP